MLRKNLKLNYFGFLGLLGFMGFGDPWYFLFFLFFLFFWAPKGKKSMPELMQKQAQEKAEHKKKILDMLSSRDRIANKDVENGLGVSDATATRYLDELEKQGIIEQVGTDGQYVYYKKI